MNALVLVGPVVSGLAHAGHFLERNLRNSVPFSASKDLEAAVRRWIEDPYLIAPGNSAARARFGEILRADPWAIRGTIHPNPPERPALPRLPALRIPALIVVGESDIPDVHAHSGAIEAGVPASLRVVLSGAGHLVAIEKPEALAELSPFSMTPSRWPRKASSPCSPTPPSRAAALPRGDPEASIR